MRLNNSVTVPVYSAPREIKDPASNLRGFKNLKTFEILMKASDVPTGLPLDPNPRKPRPKGKTYLEIIDSLHSNDGLFHKKNKGMTLVVGDTEYDPISKRLTLKFRKGKDKKLNDGILDGGHTYSIITENSDESLDNQYVKATILVGVPSELIPVLSSGLNNSTALNEASRMNHTNQFEWIKKSLSGKPYASDVVYFQNDEGNILVDDIIAIMTAMNIDLYPTKDKTHPIVAYSSKGSCLNRYAENVESYMKFERILPDILELYETISPTLKDEYNAQGGNAGLLKIFNSTKLPSRGIRRYQKFNFIDHTDYHKLEKAILMPVLSSFRTQLKTVKSDGREYFAWKRGRAKVFEVLEGTAGEILDDVLNTYEDLRNINQIGKSNTLWNSLLKTMLLV